MSKWTLILLANGEPPINAGGVIETLPTVGNRPKLTGTVVPPGADNAASGVARAAVVRFTVTALGAAGGRSVDAVAADIVEYLQGGTAGPEDRTADRNNSTPIGSGPDRNDQAAGTGPVLRRFG